jgi:hypothetical protein
VIISLMCCRSVGRYVTLGASGVDAASLARTHVRAREGRRSRSRPRSGCRLDPGEGGRDIHGIGATRGRFASVT